MRESKEKISLALDRGTVREVKELSEKDGRSFSQYINRVLKEFVLENNGQNVVNIKANFENLL